MSKLEAPVEPAATRRAVAEAPSSAERRAFVIRPAPRRPHLDVRELWHFREVLATIVWRDVAVRYKQTFLGITWAFLVPLLTTTVYVVVFGKFANFPRGKIEHYQILALAGVIPMQYFASALTSSSTSLLTNLPLVTKVYFPRILLPLAGVLVPLVDFLVGLTVLVGGMAIYNTWPTGLEVLSAPLFIGLAFATALGIGFLLSAVTVRYRDVPFIIPLFLQLMPLVSGVIYALQALPEKWQWVLAFNPMAAVISGWRWAIVGGDAPHWGQTGIGVAMTLMIFLVGLTVFRVSEPRLADTI